MSALSAPYLHDEAAAFEHVEAMLWPNGPVCPHCGSFKKPYALKGVRSKPSKKHPKGKVRHGLKKCRDCNVQFTVRVGTIFESSHIDLHLWLQAIYLMATSKKGISANQLHRTLGVTLKSAWFLSHRIREAMRSGDFAAPFGSKGTPVEVDETYIGRKKGVPKKHGYQHKLGVLALVDRESGQMRTFTFENTGAAEIYPIVRANVAREARLMTDEARVYVRLGREYADHGTTQHAAKQYVDFDDRTIHTNTVEGAFSIFKRGMKGVYQHCGERHLHRYLAEYEFRYNNREARGVGDRERAGRLLTSMIGRRLMYRDSPAW
jgi:transposase-like protein